MSVSMENKEALEQELVTSAEAAESAAEAVAEAPAESTEAAQEEASAPAEETYDIPEGNDPVFYADNSDTFRPHDVSEDGSPHGPLDLFSDGEEEKKDVPAFAAFHAPDGRKPGELDPEDEEKDYAPATRKDDEDEDDEEEEFEEGEAPMSLMGHLNELRRRLFRIVIIVILGFVAFYGVAEYLYAYLSAPLQAQLPEGSKLIYTSPAGAFFTYMKVALVASLFGTSPITFYQVWAFIAPGLYKEEKRAVLPLAFFSSIFFIAGAAFCFFMVFPIAFKFFMGFATDTIVPMISVEEYLGFALKLLIAFGVVFEMPLFAYFLSRFGILSPDFMRRQRRYAILFIFIIAAVLTPPDVFSQCLMALPMLLLYEVSIYVSAIAYPKKKEAKAEENDEESDENTEEQA
jgi:sec-independent protein translocase protein TatC